jgi:hypothetical protein
VYNFKFTSEAIPVSIYKAVALSHFRKKIIKSVSFLAACKQELAKYSFGRQTQQRYSRFVKDV